MTAPIGSLVNVAALGQLGVGKLHKYDELGRAVVHFGGEGTRTLAPKTHMARARLSESTPVRFKTAAGDVAIGDIVDLLIACDRRQAPVDKWPVERRIMREDDVGGRKDLDGCRLVYDLTSTVIRRKPGQFGDPGVERDARILTPDPRHADLNHAPPSIEPKTLDRQFDNPVGFSIKAGRFYVNRHANPAGRPWISIMESRHRHQPAQDPIIRMTA